MGDDEPVSEFIRKAWDDCIDCCAGPYTIGIAICQQEQLHVTDVQFLRQKFNTDPQKLGKKVKETMEYVTLRSENAGRPRSFFGTKDAEDHFIDLLNEKEGSGTIQLTLMGKQRFVDYRFLSKLQRADTIGILSLGYWEFDARDLLGRNWRI